MAVVIKLPPMYSIYEFQNVRGQKERRQDMEDELKDENGKWDLEKITEECERELNGIGIPIGKIIRVNMIKDKYIFGKLVRGRRDGTYILHIPDIYINPRHKLEEIKTVICHQILHTVKDCANHGKTWEEYAKKVDREYGYNIMEHAAARPKAGINWAAGVIKKDRESDGRCCYIDYVERLKEIADECADELKKINLMTGTVSGVGFMKDKFAYGLCRHNHDGTYTIFISHKYGNNDADIFGLKGIMCHELLHTCPDDDSDSKLGIHGPKWREMARLVEAEYGYKMMAQSKTDAIRRTSDVIIFQYACPNCGGYFNIYDAAEKKKMSERGLLLCKWCLNAMNPIRGRDVDTLGSVHQLAGECRDKLQIAGIPVRLISGIGFVSRNTPAGLHNNWNGSYSINLPGRFKRKGVIDYKEIKGYLCRELVRTCRGCGNYGMRWEKYVKRAEGILGFPILSENRT
ncbi:MAG: hypothetical protein K2N34_10520 [Lachnospiraceae bacterium]|nr:hypothetical protein [Lachnospiraceae bacterium]